MARLLKTETEQKLICVVSTIFEDGTSSDKVFTVGDVVSLRYIKDAAVESVVGKVKALDYTLPNRLSYNSLKPENTLNNDITLSSIRIDASTEYESNIVTVPVREIVEDAGVENVERMNISAEVKLSIKQSYTNGVTTVVELQPGDLLSDVKIMTEPLKPDVTGNFTLVGFGYSANKSGKISIDSLILQNDTTPAKAYSITKFIKLTEVMQYNIENTDSLLLVLQDPEVKQTVITVNEPINVESSLVVPAGKEVRLNMEELSVPDVAEGERSLYAINNYGDLTIDNITYSARGIQNYGNMIINNADGTARDMGGSTVWAESGDLTINGGIYKATYVGSVSDPYGTACLTVRPDATCIVNDGEFRDDSNRCYAIISNGNTTINNAYVCGAHGGCSANSGTLVINDGYFESYNHYGLYISDDGGSATHVTVNGGTFKGKTYSVWLGSDNNSNVQTTLIINGGRFLNPLKVQNNVAENCGIICKGGYYNCTVEQLTPFVAEGYEIKQFEDGYLEVVKSVE